MLHKRALLALVLAAVGAGCAETEADEQTFDIGVKWDNPSVGPTGRWPGQKAFESAAPWSRIWRPWLRALAADKEATGRAVEESDIVKIDGNRLFVLNPYRGLIAVDITTPDKPVLEGRLRVQGSPQEMYVKGNLAFVLMNGMYSWDASQEYRSALLVVDVANPKAPKLLSEHVVDGTIVDSRIVGSALYVVSSAWDHEKGDATTHVTSLAIGKPQSIAQIERVSFPGSGNVIHVTSELMFVAKHTYPDAKIQLIDIRDPAGHMVLGSEIAVEGFVQDRFMMDYAGGHLRIVSHKWDDGGHILVTTYALAGTELAETGKLDLGQIGQLTAARFDGGRVYLVHQVQIDPLDVVDLTDPKAPKLLDRIEIPGWLEHLEVRQNRIVGIGYDVAGTPAPGKLCPGTTYEPLASGRKLAVALYDVSKTGSVCEAARVRFGTGDWAWSNGFADHKALKLLDAEKLLLVPFSTWTAGDDLHGVQLVDVDLGEMGLAARGFVANATQVDRSFTTKSRLMVLGSRELAVANILDRDKPLVTASLELARNVVAFQTIPNKKYAVQLVGGDWNEPAVLRIVDAAKADAEAHQVLSQVSVGAPAGEMFVDGTTVTVLSRSYGQEGPKARLSNFDVSKPTKPAALGTLELPLGYGMDVRPLALTRFVPTTDVVRVRPDLFVVSAPESDGMRFSVVSNKDPKKPVVSHEHHQPLDKSVVLDLKSWWNELFVVSYTPVETATPELPGDGHVIAADRGTSPDFASNVRWFPPFETRQDRVKYHVTRVGFSADGKPTIGKSINVPGRLVDVAPDGKIFTLLDNRWDKASAQQKKELFTVKVAKSTATLLDGVPLTEGVEDVKVRGNAAYYTEMWSDWRGPIVPLAETVEAGSELIAPEPAKSELKLVVLNYKNPAKIHEASRTTVADDGSYGSLLDVRQVGGARYGFIAMGWGGLSIWDVTKSSAPVLYEFVRSLAWFSNVTVSPEQGAAYIAGGYYGVETIPLAK
jgi:hypothetical protein